MLHIFFKFFTDFQTFPENWDIFVPDESGTGKLGNPAQPKMTKRLNAAIAKKYFRFITLIPQR
jgi:hypothetical protein